LFGGSTLFGTIARLYRNDNGAFVDVNAGLLPVLWASAAGRLTRTAVSTR
jgi:hypothetical protein